VGLVDKVAEGSGVADGLGEYDEVGEALTDGDRESCGVSKVEDGLGEYNGVGEVLTDGVVEGCGVSLGLVCRKVMNAATTTMVTRTETTIRVFVRCFKIIFLPLFSIRFDLFKETPHRCITPFFLALT
jgi:hypothetical protein